MSTMHKSENFNLSLCLIFYIFHLPKKIFKFKIYSMNLSESRKIAPWGQKVTQITYNYYRGDALTDIFELNGSITNYKVLINAYTWGGIGSIFYDIQDLLTKLECIVSIGVLKNVHGFSLYSYRLKWSSSEKEQKSIRNERHENAFFVPRGHLSTQNVTPLSTPH